MKTSRLLVIFFIIFLPVGTVYAEMTHGSHGGSGKGSSSAGSCEKARLAKFSPPHLATVSPEAGFSFLAFNIDRPEQITVMVKNIPVEVTAEFKDPYYLIKGKMPASLVNTAARINIKVSAKSSHCEAEDGWLLKVNDK
ncbi:hypothetical protein [Methylobacter psychrophilus]|jgi:hypothetical protein|uniref:hypothetical protein n=1 Tax=Methylobacter psychrophilus TaxID=96941 RepID=UPI0021D4EA7D|nr:hypothetical protein [Methylobacter psychrophilus]